MADLRACLSAVDNDAKQAAFGVGAILGLVFLAGLVMFAFTGEVGLMLAAVVWLGIIAVLVLIGWAAGRLFPTSRR